LLQHPYSSSLARTEFHFCEKCRKTLMDIAVLLAKEQKGSAKPDCEKNVRGFSDTILSFAKLCKVNWSLNGKQIQISKGHILRQGWPISNHRMTATFLETRPRSALVYTHFGMNGWFTGCCFKSNDLWFLFIISVGRVAQSVYRLTAGWGV